MKISDILKENIIKIDNIFETIKEKLEDNFFLIVEGKKDIRKLKLIGIDKNIIPISSKSLINFVETIPNANGFIILTDFDRKGETMAKRLQDLLYVKSAEVDTNLRNSLKFYFKKFCKDIESVIKVYLKTKNGWIIHEN